MLCDIVVAHYNEDIKWINNLDHTNIRNIFVYHKRKTTKIFKKKEPINTNKKVIDCYLPNIGRESHTYLTYCIDQYNNIPKFVYFLQGNPFCHGFSLAKMVDQISTLQRKSAVKKNHYGFHRTSALLGLGSGRIDHWANSETQKSNYNMFDWFKEYITTENIDLASCYVCFGANFGVSGNRILSREKKDYIRIRDIELSTFNPEAGHYMERSWFYLFNLHKT